MYCLLDVETFDLLLIAEHFERRFDKHGEEAGGPVGRANAT